MILDLCYYQYKSIFGFKKIYEILDASNFYELRLPILFLYVYIQICNFCFPTLPSLNSVHYVGIIYIPIGTILNRTSLDDTMQSL